MPRSRILNVPSPSLVVIIGPAGSGKTTFCRRHFLPTRIVGSDDCRALLTDDPGDQSASGAAFGLAHRIVEERLRRARLTVFDATNVEPAARRCLVNLAALFHLPAVAIVLDLSLEECIRRDRNRADRRVGKAVIGRQHRQLRRSLPSLKAEGFAAVHRIRSAASAATSRITATPLPCDRAVEAGPFDIIGDVHGCAREFASLLNLLGYERRAPGAAFSHPEDRRVVLVGDLVDRGPQVVEAARIAMRMVEDGTALCVPGNHDIDLADCLRDGEASDSTGTMKSIRQIETLPPPERRRFVRRFLDFVAGLPSHLVLDSGRLAVSHAGLKTEFVGRDSEAVRRFALHGETTGEVDAYGLPVRVKWAAAYDGGALVVYGHTPVPEPEWLNNTVNIDTGCVYGGKLTALRYPEREMVAVPARRTYYQSRRALPRGVGLRAATSAVPNV